MNFINNKKVLYGIEIALITFLIFAFIYTNIITRWVIAIALGIFTIACVIFLKNDKTNSLFKNQIIATLFASAVIYIIMLYMLGIYFGFYNSTVQFGTFAIKRYIIPYILIIIFAETIRKNILLKSNSKVSRTLITIALIMLDVILTTDIKNLTSLEEYVTLLGFVIFASIANNLLYNYIVIKFNTNIPTIIYKLITTLYVFIIPITPDIYVFFESIIRMIYPYLIYLLLDKQYNKERQTSIKKITKKQIIGMIFVGIFTCMIVMLVSCKFLYSVLVIGSGSMTGTINKGDIIVYKKYDNKEIEVGEILVFDKEGTTTVHRVINEKEDADGIKYYTKGDANQQKDIGYITEQNVKGRYLFRIQYIGYLNLWIADLFSLNI